MPVPRAFKTDESFLEKIVIGATGTRRTFANLVAQGHDPLELERGSMSYKIWKAIKIKRVRVPDILCLRCAHRVESRAKTRMELSMSHSLSVQERGWDFGLGDDDRIAFAYCESTGSGPLDWSASPLVQYVLVDSLRQTSHENKVLIERPKGAQEGFEIRIIWPTAIASASGIVEAVGPTTVRYRRADNGRATIVRLSRRNTQLTPLVTAGDQVESQQIIASVVPVKAQWPCPGGASVATYVALSASSSLSDRYTAVKALGRCSASVSTSTLLQRMQDPREHVYVRVDAAAGLMRRNHPAGRDFLAAAVKDTYLENRLEAAIVLSEVANDEAASLLISTLQDPDQHPEIRAGAAWSLGEIGLREALPALVQSFTALDTTIKIEAARALAKLARRHLDDVLLTLPESTPEQRPGVAWALSKAGGFNVEQLLPALANEDLRQWIAYIVGTQDRASMLTDIEALAKQDPEVYFAVTVLWKIIASWVYGLEEY